MRKTSKTAILVVSVFGLAELYHYWKLTRRYNHFNDFRQPNITQEQMCEMTDAILEKNPNLFERALLFEHTLHITNKDEFYDSMRTHEELRPSNKLQVGCTKLFWRYHLFAFEIAMKIVRQLGNGYMRYCLKYTREWHNTTDGWYSVWTHEVPGTKPIVFFPGFGLGAIPYAKYAKQFKRTVHMIEVPNMGYATPMSDGHATSKTIYELVSIYGIAPDVFAHSMGSSHAAIWLNETTQRNGALLPEHNVVICDGWVNPTDTMRSHMYPFVDYCDYPRLDNKQMTLFKFYIFLWTAVHNLELTSWTKRYINVYDSCLWREYPKANIKYVYSENDILYDSKYITDNCVNSVCIGRGGHGSVIFGKKSEYAFSIIQKWLSQQS
jgi:hypothetical protein